MIIIAYNGEEYFDVEYKYLHIHQDIGYYPEIRYKDDIIKHCSGIVESELLLENIRQCMGKGIPIINLKDETYKRRFTNREQFNNVSSIYSI